MYVIAGVAHAEVIWAELCFTQVKMNSWQATVSSPERGCHNSVPTKPCPWETDELAVASSSAISVHGFTLV